ncbi:putative membrane protein YgcG, partial [Ralstonia pickettii]
SSIVSTCPPRTRWTRCSLLRGSPSRRVHRVLTEHLTFLRKELNRCMQRPDGQYFDLSATLAESAIASRDSPREVQSHSQSRPLRGEPAVRSLAETSRNQRTSVSSDEDWINPLNPLNPFSPLNPLAATVSPWAFWKAEPGHRDESDRHCSSPSDNGGTSISSVFSPGGDDDSRRAPADCYTPRDTGDGGGSSGGGDCGGGGGNDGGGGGDCGGGGGGD